MTNDWFRKVTWTDEDAEDFFTRLKRARSSSRSQYLYIQASYLQGTGESGLIKVAMSLLELRFREYPDVFDNSSSYRVEAECLLNFGRIDDAITSFRNSVIAQREKGAAHTTAPIEFGWVVVENQRRELYPEILTLLDEFGDDHSMFLNSRYDMLAIGSFIHQELGDHETARDFAREAIEVSKLKRSEFQKHPKLGLVKTTDTPVHRRLLRIVDGVPFDPLTDRIR